METLNPCPGGRDQRVAAVPMCHDCDEPAMCAVRGCGAAAVMRAGIRVEEQLDAMVKFLLGEGELLVGDTPVAMGTDEKMRERVGPYWWRPRLRQLWQSRQAYGELFRPPADRLRDPNERISGLEFDHATPLGQWQSWITHDHLQLKTRIALMEAELRQLGQDAGLR